jgi:RNase P subunit RPR2
MTDTFRIGDKSRTYCENCEKPVNTTLQRRDEYSTRYLAEVCDVCGHTLSFPGRPRCETTHMGDNNQRAHLNLADVFCNVRPDW